MTKTLEQLTVVGNNFWDSNNNIVNAEPVGKPELLRRMHREIDDHFIFENAPFGSNAYTQGDQIYITSSSLFDEATAYITAVQYWKIK